MGNYRKISLFAAAVFLSTACAVITVSSQTGAKETRAKESITLCHATGSASNPYETITVSANGHAHQNHSDDIVPAPAGGCPGPGGPPVPTPEPITMLLFGAGIAATGYAARKFKRKSA
jgi:hypothetical protein